MVVVVEVEEAGVEARNQMLFQVRATRQLGLLRKTKFQGKLNLVRNPTGPETKAQ